jgi:hypothetical protein
LTLWANENLRGQSNCRCVTLAQGLRYRGSRQGCGCFWLVCLVAPLLKAIEQPLRSRLLDGRLIGGRAQGLGQHLRLGQNGGNERCRWRNVFVLILCPGLKNSGLFCRRLRYRRLRVLRGIFLGAVFPGEGIFSGCLRFSGFFRQQGWVRRGLRVGL